MASNSNINSPESREQDLEAVNRVLSGDSSAFQLLQNKYNRIIIALVRKMVRNEDDVEDLAQETFIKAYKALKTFQPGYSFSAWIYRIASNTCIDFLRKKRFMTVSLSQPVGNSDDDYFFEIEDKSYVPDIGVLADERKKALKEAIENLPDNYREIIKLRHEEEMDYNQISKQLDLPLGTVKAHLFRARKLLLADLKKKKELFTDM
jgi:RNA polymerase sigma factor (sigma-70 family)